jgi:hypothetical protein
MFEGIGLNAQPESIFSQRESNLKIDLKACSFKEVGDKPTQKAK